MSASSSPDSERRREARPKKKKTVQCETAELRRGSLFVFDTLRSSQLREAMRVAAAEQGQGQPQPLPRSLDPEGNHQTGVFSGEGEVVEDEEEGEEIGEEDEEEEEEEEDNKENVLDFQFDVDFYDYDSTLPPALVDGAGAMETESATEPSATDSEQPIWNDGRQHLATSIPLPLSSLPPLPPLPPLPLSQLSPISNDHSPSIATVATTAAAHALPSPIRTSQGTVDEPSCLTSTQSYPTTTSATNTHAMMSVDWNRPTASNLVRSAAIPLRDTISYGDGSSGAVYPPTSIKYSNGAIHHHQQQRGMGITAAKNAVGALGIGSSPRPLAASQSHKQPKQEFKIAVCGDLQDIQSFMSSFAGCNSAQIHPQGFVSMLLQAKQFTLIKITFSFYAPASSSSSSTSAAAKPTTSLLAAGENPDCVRNPDKDGYLFVFQRYSRSALSRIQGLFEHHILAHSAAPRLLVLLDRPAWSSSETTASTTTVEWDCKEWADRLRQQVVLIASSLQSATSSSLFPEPSDAIAAIQLLLAKMNEARIANLTREFDRRNIPTHASTTATPYSAAPAPSSPPPSLPTTNAALANVPSNKLPLARGVSPLSSSSPSASPSSSSGGNPVISIGLLGAPGVGKSSFLHRLMLQAAVADTKTNAGRVTVSTGFPDSSMLPSVLPNHLITRRDVWVSQRCHSVEFTEMQLPRNSQDKLQFYRDVSRLDACVIVVGADSLASSQVELERACELIENITAAKTKSIYHHQPSANCATPNTSPSPTATGSSSTSSSDKSSASATGPHHAMVHRSSVGALPSLQSKSAVPVVVVVNKMDTTGPLDQAAAASLTTACGPHVPLLSLSTQYGYGFSHSTQLLHQHIIESCLGIRGSLVTTRRTAGSINVSSRKHRSSSGVRVSTAPLVPLTPPPLQLPSHPAPAPFQPQLHYHPQQQHDPQQQLHTNQPAGPQPLSATSDRHLQQHHRAATTHLATLTSPRPQPQPQFSPASPYPSSQQQQRPTPPTRMGSPHYTQTPAPPISPPSPPTTRASVMVGVVRAPKARRPSMNSQTAHAIIDRYVAIEELLEAMRHPKSGIPIRDHKLSKSKKKKTEPKCFSGTDAVSWVTRNLASRGKPGGGGAQPPQTQQQQQQQALEQLQELMDLLVMRRIQGGRTFEPDGDSLYRFAVDEDNTSVVNLRKVYIGGVGTATIEVEQLLLWLLDSIPTFLVKQRSGGFVLDADQMRNSPFFSEWALSTSKLQRTSLSNLTQVQRLAFWINCYNLMSYHIYIQLGAPGKSQIRRKQLYCRTWYQIDGMLYSLDDILFGILRCNKRRNASAATSTTTPPASATELGATASSASNPNSGGNGSDIPSTSNGGGGKLQFKAGDPRAMHALSYDPRIHFVLATMATQSPAIAPLRAGGGMAHSNSNNSYNSGSGSIVSHNNDPSRSLDAQLSVATRRYLDQHTEINFKEGTVLLPALVHTWKSDFGGTGRSVLTWVANHLPEEKRKMLNFLLSRGIRDKDIRYRSEDLTPAAPPLLRAHD